MCALQGIVHDAVRLGVSVLPASKSIVSIQVLRALAALAVLTYHVPIELSSRLGLHDVVPRFLIGAAGVDLFFVISGFIIVYASEMLFGRWDAPYVFFVRRLVRIVPLYWACTGLIVAYWMIARVDFNSIDISFGAIIGSFLFLPYPRPSGGMMPVIMLGWTVNHEMFFYAAFAGVIFLSRRRTVLTVITVFVAIVMAGQVFKPLPPTITFWSDPIILEFCFGMLIAAAYREGMRLPRVAAIALILAGALGYLASGLWSGYAGSRVIEWGMPATAIVAGSVLSNELPSSGDSRKGARVPWRRILLTLSGASHRVPGIAQSIVTLDRSERRPMALCAGVACGTDIRRHFHLPTFREAGHTMAAENSRHQTRRQARAGRADSHRSRRRAALTSRPSPSGLSKHEIDVKAPLSSVRAQCLALSHSALAHSQLSHLTNSRMVICCSASSATFFQVPPTRLVSCSISPSLRRRTAYMGSLAAPAAV